MPIGRCARQASGWPPTRRSRTSRRAFRWSEHYRDWNFVDPRIDAATKIVEFPRPAGVIFALIPSTNPIATINFKALIALMTRNAIVISPHPAARACCVDAVRTLAQAAEAAGAPEGILQVVETPSIPLIDQFMQSPRTDLILATGGTAMVRAAYSSSNPALGVGPGNAPVYVDASADLKHAARCIVESKSFDNSVLCTNESVVITTETIERPLLKELERAGLPCLHRTRGEGAEALSVPRARLQRRGDRPRRGVDRR
jgi:acyl-CoA reductase-like NAD-dependent aldehyde dehydrogenase